MIPRSLYDRCCREALTLVDRTGVVLTDAERAAIEAADFGLSDHRRQGLQLITLFATDRLSMRLLVLLPNQTEPEHRHPPITDGPTPNPGKEEHIRALYGDLRFYLPGEDTLREGFVPEGKEDVYTLRHEVILRPGDQLALPAGTPHWFQSGPAGAVFFSTSTTVHDGLDHFTDPAVVRETVIDETA